MAAAEPSADPVARWRRDLTRPAAYPHAVDDVEVLQTHISALFFAGDRVYKLKKPLDLGFLDFRTLESRRHFCREEVRLNRRLARGTYLGVVPIVAGEDGRLRVSAALDPRTDEAAPPAPEAEPVEYAVVMRRLPAHRMLDRLLAEGEIDDALVGRLAELLADFHARADTGDEVSRHGKRAAIARNTADNLAHLRASAERVDGGPPLAPEAWLAFLERRLRAFLDEHVGLFERRVAEGRIRDGHGDLHAGNVCVLPGGEFVIFDCIEFQPAFRCCDVAADLAFLTMDLDLGGYRAFARHLVREYVQRSSDRELPQLMEFHQTNRALIRAKVTAIQALDAGLPDEERAAARHQVLRHLQLALSYWLPPALVITCGLPGSGKSTLARPLARALDAPWLRSDVVRKELAGLPPHAPSSPEARAALYSTAMTDRTYAELLARARDTLASGRSVVIDATFARQDQRQTFAALAAEFGAPFGVAHCTASADEIERRLARREAQGGDPSDADIAVYRAVRERFTEPEGPCVATVGAGQAEADALASVFDRLVAAAGSEARE